MSGIKAAQRERIEITLIDIARVSERLSVAIAQSNTTGPGMQVLVSARTRLAKIIAASRAILAQSLDNDASLDPRLDDWLRGREPEMCLWTLEDMENLIPANPSGGTWFGRVLNRAVNSTSFEAKINEAIKLFDKRGDIFHFLLTTEVWNSESRRTADEALEITPAMDPKIDGLHRVRSQTRGNLKELQTLVSCVGVDEVEKDIKKDSLQEEKKNEFYKKFDSLIEWLDGFNCNEKYEGVLNLRQPGTCKWLPETRQYGEWKKDQDSFLWLQAGSGKTVLATSLIETIEQGLQDGEHVVFFYCDFRDERTARAAGAMCSILSQLLYKLRNGNSPDLTQLVDDLVKEKTKGTSILKHANRIVSFVSRTARLLDRQPFVVIDALDECQDVESLLCALRELTKGGMRLFVTSRPLQVIKDHFHGFPFISMDQMAEELSADIELHVTKEIEGDRRLRILPEKLKIEICDVLQRGADGMFRWIQCQINSLKECFTVKDIQETLQNLPVGLEETYERILRGIDPLSQKGKVARRALVCLVAALRSLHLVEIIEALSVDLEARRLDHQLAPVHGFALLDALGSLVVYNEETDIVHLSHFTVKEYLIGSLSRANLPMHHIDLQVAHGEVLRLCMGYITALIHHPSQLLQHDSSLDSDSVPDIGIEPPSGPPSDADIDSEEPDPDWMPDILVQPQLCPSSNIDSIPNIVVQPPHRPPSNIDSIPDIVIEPPSPPLSDTDSEKSDPDWTSDSVIELPDPHWMPDTVIRPPGPHWTLDSIRAVPSGLWNIQKATLMHSPLPLLGYVLIHGFYHLAHLYSVNSLILDELASFRLVIHQHPAEWAQIIKLARSYSSFIGWLSPEHDFVAHLFVLLLPAPALHAFLCHTSFSAFDGTSPLVYAAHWGMIEHARTLLLWGINVCRAGWDIETSRQLVPLEVAFYSRHPGRRSLFHLFLKHWRAPVPFRLFSTLFSTGMDSWHWWGYEEDMIITILQCDEFAEWATQDQHRKILLSVSILEKVLMLREYNIIAVLCRFLQVGLDLSLPESLPSTLHIAWHAMSENQSRVLGFLCSQKVTIPFRILSRQEVRVLQKQWTPTIYRARQGDQVVKKSTVVEKLLSQGHDLGTIITYSDLEFKRVFGKCKHGSSCWMPNCSPCSKYLKLVLSKQCFLVDVLIIGRTGAGKSTLVNMMTCVPGNLPGVVEMDGNLNGSTLPRGPISYAVLLQDHLALQVWDTPGFDKASNIEHIKLSIHNWIQHVSSIQLEHDESSAMSPIIQVVWCMHASDIDDPVAWQQFYAVYAACHSRGILPSLILNQIMDTVSPIESGVAYEDRMQKLDVPIPGSTLPRILMSVRNHRDVSSAGYKEDCRVLREVVYRCVRDLQIPVGIRSYTCQWESGGTRCGQMVSGWAYFLEHLLEAHSLNGRSTICRWIGCNKHNILPESDIVHHIKDVHLYGWKKDSELLHA